MFILTAYQTKNRCYKRGRKAKHVGILVHSTGAVNRNIKRYVDAPERLGVNTNGNHWNKEAADKCMHAFIGYDKDGEVIVANTLPYDFSCWGCGAGSNGSYNYDPTAHIQFEICQGSNTDEAYYRKAIEVAAEYCAYLCKQFSFKSSDICSHREAARAGYASNHGDPESWMRNFNDDMNRFRARVAVLLGEEINVTVQEGGSQSTMTTLRQGSKGDAVKTLQNALLTLGYALPRYGADGSFGAETLAALRQFQTDKGLSVDGVCGEKTQAAITAALASLEPPDEPAAPDESTNRLFIVTIPGVDAATATYLVETYEGAQASDYLQITPS